MKILVLEDSPTAMLDIVNKLSRIAPSASIMQAYNYDQAVFFVENISVDMVFTDLSMPKENGMDFIVGFLLSHKLYCGIPIIVTTGVDPNSLLKPALHNKVYRYLEKPLVESELQEAIKSYFDHGPLS